MEATSKKVSSIRVDAHLYWVKKTMGGDVPIAWVFSPNFKGSYAVARVFTLPIVPVPKRRRAPRITDERYIQGQKVLVEAMKYLVQTDPDANRDAIGLLSEHFRTQFRMSDRPVVD